MSKFESTYLSGCHPAFRMVRLCWLMILIPALWACGKNEGEFHNYTGRPLEVGENSGARINAALRYSRDFQQAGPEQVADKIGQSFRRHINNGPLALGSSLDNRFAWLYLEIANPGNTPRTVTLITTHVRCDRLELFRLDGKEVVPIGDLSRATPVASRPYKDQEFALPVEMPANDTTRVLMRITRRIGAMEVDFRLFDENDFLEQQYLSRVWDIFNLAFVLVITLLSLIIGLNYHNLLMLFFGIFLTFTFLVYSYVLNFWDGFGMPSFTGLTSDTLGSFFALLQGIFFHPFGNEILKSYGIRSPVYQRITAFLMIIGGTIAIALLTPAPWVEAVFVRCYTVLTLCNIGCLLFVTGKVYRQTGEKWLLVIAILVFAPTLISLPLRLLYFSDQFYAAVMPPNIPLITVLLAFFTAKQLLRKLISKAELERRLVQIKLEMNEMRKEEVQKIGRNLHDQLGNTLASVLGYINMDIPDLKQVQKLLKQAIQEIRFTSHNLVKDEELPLSGKIGALVERFNDFSAIHFQFYDYSTGKTDQLDDLQQQNIYLIIQELLTNAVRYSMAQEMVLQAFDYGTSVQFIIEEDGKGFDPVQKTNGLGIKNMIKRAELADLQLTFESSEGNGTNVIIVAKYTSSNTLGVQAK